MTFNSRTASLILATAWNTKTPCPGIPQDSFPESIVQAYEIQDLLTTEVDDEVAGWKVGFPPSGAISGRVFSRNLHSSPINLSSVTYPEPNLECEIAFRISADPPILSRIATREDYSPIMKAYSAIELTGRRVAGAPHGPSNEREVRDIIADNSGGAGLVIGPELNGWRDLDFSTIAVDLEIANKPAPMIPDANKRDLVMVVVDLANQLAERGLDLRNGDYISTGSLTEPTRLPVGADARAVYKDIGEINLRLE